MDGYHSYPPPPSYPKSPAQPAFQPFNHTRFQPSPFFDQTPASNATTSPNYPSPLSSSGTQTPNDNPELKRVRNTAASARFRAKKKRHEEALEQSSRETRETLAKLEVRIRELEAENRFLKGLIFDREKLDGVRKELERVTALKRELEREGDDDRKRRDDDVERDGREPRERGA